MRKSFIIILVVLCLLTTIAFADDTAEMAAVRKAIEELYFKGQKHHDRELLSRVFHESGHLHAVLSDGSFWTMPAPQWIRRKDPSKEPSQSDYYIDEITIAGTAASVTAREETRTWVITDHLNLLKIDGKWRIVSKIFYSRKK